MRAAYFLGNAPYDGSDVFDVGFVYDTVWLPVSINTLNGSGTSSFSDSESANYPARFYRFRSP